jgi:hypothetical protein
LGLRTVERFAVEWLKSFNARNAIQLFTLTIQRRRRCHFNARSAIQRFNLFAWFLPVDNPGTVRYF